MRSVRLSCLAAVLTLVAAGCGGDVPRTRQICERAQTCNDLGGVNVEQCTDAAEAALRGLTSAQRADWDRAADACLAFHDCANFAACVRRS